MTLTDAATGLVNEIIWVTARAADSLTVVRGQEATSAKAWLAGDFASNLLTAGQMSAIQGSNSAFTNRAVYQIIGGVQQVSVNGAAYTSVGAGVFTWPASGTALVEGTGAGASAGSMGTTTTNGAAGGGAGATCKDYITGQTPGSTTVVTLGVAGASVAGTGTANGANGNAGTATTFGVFFSAGGGSPGQGAAGLGATAGGLGGVATGATININGGPGEDGGPTGGTGGNGVYGGAGVGRATSAPQLDGAAPGAGGGGPYDTAGLRSGAGDNGILIVDF